MDVATQAGADAMIRDNSRFVSTYVDQLRGEVADVAALATNPPTAVALMRMASSNQKLVDIYTTLDCVARFASPDAFALIPAPDFEIWINYVSSVLKEKATLSNVSRQWIARGVPQKHNELNVRMLLNTLISFFVHPTFVQLVLEKRGQGDCGGCLLSILAAFVADRLKKPDLRYPDICESIIGVVVNCISTSSMNGLTGGQELEKDKIMKQLESTGLLAQFLRCITVPIPDQKPDQFIASMSVLDNLLGCTGLAKKKLIENTPTGAILQDILDGKDGYSGRRNEQVMIRLRNISKLASMSNESIAKCQQARCCSNCGKASASADFQNSLKTCR